MTELALAIFGYIAFIAIVVGVLRRMNGPDTDAQEAADSVRQALDFEELRTYTQRPHIKAGTAYGKELT